MTEPKTHTTGIEYRRLRAAFDLRPLRTSLSKAVQEIRVQGNCPRRNNVLQAWIPILHQNLPVSAITHWPVERHKIREDEKITAGVHSSPPDETQLQSLETDRTTIVQSHKTDPTARVIIPLHNGTELFGTLVIDFPARDSIRNELVEFFENVGLMIETLDDSDGSPANEEDQAAVRWLRDHYLDLRKKDAIRVSFLENSPSPTCMINFDGVVTWANKAFQTLTGYFAHELQEMKLKRLVAPESYRDFKSLLKRFQTGLPSHVDEFTFVNKADSSRLLECWSMLLQGEHAAAGVGFVFRDISETRQARKQLETRASDLEAEVRVRTREVEETQFAAILAMAKLVESIDADTEGHIDRVRHYARILAAHLKNHPRHKGHITDEYVDLIFHLSPLHDIGKVGISDAILRKPGKLTKEEFQVITTHTTIGGDALRAAGERLQRKSIFAIAEMIARYHHEKWDGSGYPAVHINGEFRPLRGEEIPLSARIVALADVYDALSSKRPYKDAFPHERVKEIIVNDRGTHFDPDIVDAFLELEEEFLSIRARFTPGIDETGTNIAEPVSAEKS